jgi:hypothetical protein
MQTRAMSSCAGWQGSELCRRDTMSETGLQSNSTVRPNGGELYDATGQPIAHNRPERDLETLVRFSREQPLATALIALGIGYLLGKML